MRLHIHVGVALMPVWLMTSAFSAIAQPSTELTPPTRLWVDGGFGIIAHKRTEPWYHGNPWVGRGTKWFALSLARNRLVVTARYAAVYNAQSFGSGPSHYNGRDLSLQAGMLLSTGRSLLRLAAGVGQSRRPRMEEVFDEATYTYSYYDYTEQLTTIPLEAEACWTLGPYIGVGLGVYLVWSKAPPQFGSQFFLRFGKLE